MSPDGRKCLGPPRCRFTSVEGVSKHEPGCPMLLPPAKVERDPLRLPTAAVIGMLTGAEPTKTRVDDEDVEMLYGVPAAIGVEIPLTHRVGDYMGQPRDGWTGFAKSYGTVAPPGDPTVDNLGKPLTLAEAGLPPALIAWHDTLRMTLADDYVLLQPEEQRLIDDIKKGETAGELRKAIDRFMAHVYDQQIDALAAKRREHTKRLIK